MKNNLTDEEIYQKAKRRIKKGNDYHIIIELEKEIDYYRNEIKKMVDAHLDDGLIWFKVNQNTDSEQLHNFLLKHIPMGEVLNLYRLLKKDMEV